MIRASQITLLLLLYLAVLTAHRKRFSDKIRSINQSINPGLGHLDHKLHKLVIFTHGNQCEKCKLFEHTIAALKRRMHPWQRLLSIVVLNCQEIPNPCLGYMRAEAVFDPPVLRYFPANKDKKKPLFATIWMGYEIKSRETEAITQEVAFALEHNEPNLTPLQTWESDRSIFKHGKWKYVVLVFQPKNSVIAALTALDMLPYHEVKVRIVDDRGLFDNFGMKEFGQTVAVLQGGEITHRWTPSPATAEEYIKLLRLHLLKHPPANEDTTIE